MSVVAFIYHCTLKAEAVVTALLQQQQQMQIEKQRKTNVRTFALIFDIVSANGERRISATGRGGGKIKKFAFVLCQRQEVKSTLTSN